MTARYDAPKAIDRAFNRVFTFLLELGVGLRHNYLLEVRGRTTGRRQVVPVDLLDLDGRQFLVAGRGRTQWVRNAEAAGEVTLRKGRTRRQFTVRAVPTTERPAILKAYLDRFKPTVQRYFPVRAGSPVSDFVAVADGYPVFELTPR